jgi:hypothetical protein
MAPQDRESNYQGHVRRKKGPEDEEVHAIGKIRQLHKSPGKEHHQCEQQDPQQLEGSFRTEMVKPVQSVPASGKRRQFSHL